MPKYNADAAAAQREEGKEAPSFVLGGKDYVLPIEMPLGVVAYLGELKDLDPVKDGPRVVVSIMGVMEDLLGKEQYKAFRAARPSVDTLNGLLEWALSEYGFEEEAVGESPASTS